MLLVNFCYREPIILITPARYNHSNPPPSKKTEREHACVEVSVALSPSTNGYYNKICILCIARLADLKLDAMYQCLHWFCISFFLFYDSQTKPGSVLRHGTTAYRLYMYDFCCVSASCPTYIVTISSADIMSPARGAVRLLIADSWSQLNSYCCRSVLVGISIGSRKAVI